MYRIGFQTIAWGVSLRELDRALEALRLAGYSGVEFSQVPSGIGDGRSETLNCALMRHDLQLLGLSGGDLLNRIAYCEDILRPEYLYVENIAHEEEQVLATSYHTLALHLHVFKYAKPHRLVDAKKLLFRNPGLKWIPDTAHQTIAGENPIHALRLVSSDRVACVHLKDWSSIYGRTSHRYSKGFCELGDGEVRLDEVVNTIKAELPDSWIVVEQDYTLDDPLDCLYRAAMWLHSRGLLQSAPQRVAHGARQVAYSLIGKKRELNFRHALADARAGEPGAFHTDLAEAFQKLIPSENISIWSCSSNGGILMLRGLWPSGLQVSKVALETNATLSCVAMRWQQPLCFDLTKPHPAEHLGWPDLALAAEELITNSRCKILLALPIPSTFNPNHESMLVVAIRETEIAGEELGELMDLAAEASRLADQVLDERCTYYSARLARAAERCSEVREFYEALARTLRESVGAESASALIVNSAGNRLDHKYTAAELDQRVPKLGSFYTADEGVIGSVWKTKRLVNVYPGIYDAMKRRSNAYDPRESLIVAPLLDRSGQVLGVVQCCRKRPVTPPSGPGFTDEDEAIVEAICQSAVPHLSVLLNDDRREKALLRLVHELGSPLVTMRWALTATERELLGSTEIPDAMTRKIIQDGFSYCDVMWRLVNNMRLFGLPELPLDVSGPIKLWGDIVHPTIKQSAALLLNRDFDASRVECTGFESVPGLYVDLELFRQVIFNLLSNAIKYAFHDSRAFFVKVTATKESAGDFSVSFCDYGIGVPEGWAERIFEEDVRGPNTLEVSVHGQGLGLWIARRIVEAHHGELFLKNNSMPTQFCIRLPGWLARRRPPSGENLRGRPDVI